MDRWKLNWATGTYEPELFVNSGLKPEPAQGAAPAEPDQNPAQQLDHAPSLGPYDRPPGYYGELPQAPEQKHPALTLAETPVAAPEPTREELLAAREAQLLEKVWNERIDRHEMFHDLRQYDSELLGEMIQEDREQAREEARRAREEADRPSSPELQPPENKADAALDERMAGLEMTDARQARFERLMDQMADDPQMEMTQDDGMERGGGRTM